MFEAIFDAILDAVLYVVALIFFYIESALGYLLDLLYGMFKVFVGIEKVTFNGSKVDLMSVFFGDELISTIYKGMMVIGIVLLFGFGLVKIIKKLFDSSGERVKETYGMILISMFKSVLIMMLLTAIINVVVLAVGIVLERIDYLFNNVKELNDPSTIEFSDEDYSTMFRIMDTIGNFSINPSPTNRYNINSCFNAIRQDLQSLEANRVFKYSYVGAEQSWQYYLRQIYMAADVSSDLPIDLYDSAVATSIYTCMVEIATNNNFRPLSSYTRKGGAYTPDSKLGTLIMLSSTFNAAKSSQYNGNNASINDSVRNQFYNGDKDIFDIDDVEDYFDIEFDSWNHPVCLCALAIALMEFVKILLNCIARIFNMIVLYITAPGFLAVSPLDDGGMFKQWTIAFTIQSVSIIGTYIVIRLMIMFIPIIMSNNLVLFSNAIQNMLAKTLFIIALCFTAERSNGLIGGILAGNAGAQSLMAGDVGSGLLNKGLAIGGRMASFAAKTGLSVGGSVAKGALGSVADVTGLTAVGNKIGKRLGDARKSIKEGGILGAKRNGFTSQETRDKAAENQGKADEKQDRKDMLAAMQKMAGIEPTPREGNSKGLGKDGSQGTNRGGSSGSSGGSGSSDAKTIPTFNPADTYKNFKSMGSDEAYIGRDASVPSDAELDGFSDDNSEMQE